MVVDRKTKRIRYLKFMPLFLLILPILFTTLIMRDNEAEKKFERY
jgi:hypothetical protein